MAAGVALNACLANQLCCDIIDNSIDLPVCKTQHDCCDLLAEILENATRNDTKRLEKSTTTTIRAEHQMECLRFRRAYEFWLGCQVTMHQITEVSEDLDDPASYGVEQKEKTKSGEQGQIVRQAPVFLLKHTGVDISTMAVGK